MHIIHIRLRLIPITIAVNRIIRRFNGFLHLATLFNLKKAAMFYHDSKLQYDVKVDRPDPMFAKMLQQAIGGIEGEMRVCLQYLFQAFGARGPAKYRDML